MRNVLLASAGAGKSDKIVQQAKDRAALGQKVLLLTFTTANQEELEKKLCKGGGVVPPNIVVKGWYSFLLEDMIRPYQSAVLAERVSGILLNTGNPHLGKARGGTVFTIPGRAERAGGAVNTAHFVTKEDNRAHTFYLAKLAVRVHQASGGRAAARLAKIYTAVYVDEVQDLVGWDYGVLEAIAAVGLTEVLCVGDFRQCVYSTSDTSKSPQTVTEKLKAFQIIGFSVNHLAISWRCVQSICDLADRIHAKDKIYQITKSQVVISIEEPIDHIGVFVVTESNLSDYLGCFDPVILRGSRRTRQDICDGRRAYNFGESKGLGFDRVLIIPADRHSKYLSGDDAAFDGLQTDESRNKLYVAVTRARYSVAFLVKGKKGHPHAVAWEKPPSPDAT